jgi:spermidine synthase
MILTLYAIFFLSGVSALIFETLWFHQAGLAFGNSVWASSVVLSSFMLGLAFGNSLAARLAERIRRPVRIYAGLEIAIGISGVLLVWGLPELAPLLGRLFQPFSDQTLTLNILRLGTAFVLMLIPATAMGATLPVLLQALIGPKRSFGETLGRLYGCNALGAVAGAVAGELLLVEWVGVRATGLAAAGCNALAAAGALWVSSRGAAEARNEAGEDRAIRGRLGAPALSALAAALLSGFLLLALEVIWFRFLQLFIAGTSLAFSFMLATVLAGIGVGGLLAGLCLGRWPRAHAQTPALALLAGTVCAGVYASFSIVVAPYAADIVQDPREVAWLTFALTFPVSLLSGALFTFLGSALAEQIGPGARAAGLLTLANTIGAGLGSLIAAFVLLPALGMESSLRMLAAGYGVVAIFALLATRTSWRSHKLSLGTAAALFALATLLFPAGLIDTRYLPSAVQRVARSGTWQIAAIREGLTETAVYLRSLLFGQTYYYELMTNGYAMSGTHWGSRRYMKLYVYWPVALAGPPKSALLISYGVGSTAKALTDTASLERIDVVDISREILELSEIVYPDPAEHPLRDPRVTIHIDDGRHFLQRSKRRFDLSTGEPPPPKTAGVVNLYTREHFQLIYDRLNAGGVNTYWLPVHSLTEDDTRAIIRAYCDVFEDCSLWGAWGLNFMLVGSREASWPRSESVFRAQWDDPSVGPELRSLGIEVPEQLGAMFMADAAMLAELAGDTLPLVDDFPKRLSSELPDTNGTVAVFLPWMETELARKRFATSDAIAAMWPARLRERSDAYFEIQRLINTHSTVAALGGAGERILELDPLLTTTTLRTPALWSLGTNIDQIRMAEAQREAGGPIEPLLASTLWAARAFADRDYAAAERHLAEAQQRSPRTAPLVYYRLYALCLDERSDEANRVAARAGRWLPAGDEDFWRFMQQRCGIDDPRKAAE